MSTTVLDYAGGVPTAAAIRDAGHAGAVRYLSPPRPGAGWMRGKPIHRAEVDAFEGIGLDLAFVWQYGKTRNPDVMRGGQGGRADALAAQQQLRKIGRPGAPVFFAVDFDITLDEWNSRACDYFLAAARVLGRDRVGIYGHSRVIAWAVEDGVIADAGGGRHLAWQTAAWSGGHRAPEAVLFQRPGEVTVGGVGCDVSEVLAPWWGQTPPDERPEVPTAPAPAPTAPPAFINDDPVDADWAERFGFGGPRSTDGLQGVCIHTTENRLGSRAEDVAAWQLRTESGAYHALVDNTTDDNIRSIRENTDDWVAWAAAQKGNQIALHLSYAAEASMTREEWLSAPLMLAEGADITAYWCRRYHFPVRKIGARELRQGARGIFGHVDVSHAWHQTDHTDPGSGFPWDVFLQMVRDRMPAAPGAATPRPPAPPGRPAPAPAPLTTATPITSIINPRVTLPLAGLLALLDAYAWENRIAVRGIYDHLGLDYDRRIQEAIEQDRSAS
ncbi:DUF1906 domain-containing protein [Corynebacterium sphenisci]|uniref:DUF1906 domain-containing protein n=1 Tax=Corynebacterium sphenisci TaxID=191493 RepID=UPI0009FFB783|nr:DUF1906 domain-containing protein [Corynebacterium sphenisci]